MGSKDMKLLLKFLNKFNVKQQIKNMTIIKLYCNVQKVENGDEMCCKYRIINLAYYIRWRGTCNKYL